jgi:hypothetical protein
MRNFVLWLILLVIGVLIGFVPQRIKAHRLQRQVDSCDAGLQLAQAQQSATLMYVSATQLNYGLAAGYAGQFFNQVRTLAGSTSDVALRSRLSEILSSSEKISADLSKGNPEVVSELQPILLRIEQERGL